MNELIMMLAHYLLFLLICTGALIVAHIPIQFIKYDINERYLHCRLIVVLAVLILLSGNRLMLPYILQGLDRVISNSFLTGFFNTMTPERNYELIYMLLLIILMNLFFILLADLVLGIIRLLFRNRSFISVKDGTFTEKLVHFPWLLSDLAYTEAEGGYEYEVNAKGGVWYHWIRSMKNAFILLGVIEVVGVSIIVIGADKPLAEMIRKITWGWYMLPSAGFLLFEQIQFFLEHNMNLGGNSFQSDDIDMELRGQLKNLFNLYIAYFGGTKVLLKSYEPRMVSMQSSGLKYNGVTNSQQEACKKPHVLEIISNQLREAGVRTNKEYNNVLVELLNDSSVSIRDYLQGEILTYLCAYMNYYCTEGDTFLILCMDNERAVELQRIVDERLERINRVTCMWSVGGRDKAANNETIHILVIGFQDLVSYKLLAKRKDFFKNLKMIVIDRAVTFSAYSNIHKEMIFSEFSRISKEFEKEYQYVLVSEVESPTLEASFGTYIGKDITPFKNVGNQVETYVMAWAEEGYYRTQRRLGIGGDLSEYIGVSMTLALIAVGVEFPSVHVYAGESKPLMTYRKALSANQREIRRFLRRDTDYSQWIRINDYSDILEKENLDMIVLYDDHFNLYNTLWNWLKYGGKKGTLIHIVSPQYLLRDYFADNIEELIRRENDYAPLIGWRSNLDHSRFQALLLQMANAGMLEKDVMERSREYGWDYKGIGNLLRVALNSVLKDKKRNHNIYEHFHFSEESVFNAATDNYERQVTITLINEAIKKELVRQTSFVKVNHKASERVEEIPVLRDNVMNYFLRDQVVSIKGVLRNVLNIEDGIVYTENVASETHKSYYQSSEFEIGNRQIVDHCVDYDVLDFNVYLANNVKRIIKGYWSSDRGIDLGAEAGMSLSRVYDRYGREGNDLVEIKNSIQMLEIRIPCRVAGDKAEQMVLLLAFMMQELFKTLFPDSYMNLFVITEFDAADDYWTKLFKDTTAASAEEKIHSIVPFIRPGKMEEIASRSTDEEKISLYIIEYSAIELGMISSLYQNRIKVFRIVHNYLKWYNKRFASSDPAGETEGGFLHLGLDTLPAFFASAELESFCESFLPKIEESEGFATAPDIPGGIRCSFCGKPTVFWKEMHDGRRICRDCENQMIRQEDEIRQLYETVVNNMYYHYGVRRPKNLHLRFASAEAIRKRIGKGSPYDRVLGFCERKDRGRKKALWIEARGPRNTVQSTLIHELTHYWQFEEIGLKKLNKLGPGGGLVAMEGHASYVEVSAMRDFGESDYADAMEEELMARKDEYGEGFKAFKEYMKTLESEGSHVNPFEAFKLMVEGKK